MKQNRFEFGFQLPAVLLLLTALFSFDCAAQEQAAANSTVNWLRVETAANELSAAFPPGIIVDAEKRERNQRYFITGFANGVNMVLKVYKDPDAKMRLSTVSAPEGPRTFSFQKNGYSGIRISNNAKSARFSEAIYLVKNDNFYYLLVSGNDASREEYKRFLYSIKIGGDHLFVRQDAPPYQEETVSLSSLKTSPEVTEAFTRKFEKTKGQVKHESTAAADEIIDYDAYSRPLIVVETPFPRFPTPMNTLTTNNSQFSVKLKVEFLASGQIGGITVLSSTHKDYLAAFIESVRRMRFIPARIAGANVDATLILDYSGQVSVNTFMMTGPGPRSLF